MPATRPVTVPQHPDPQSAAVGVADHNGWAVLVCVAWEGDTPVVLLHRRVELIEGSLPRQPFHHDSTSLGSADAEALVAQVKAAVRRSAHAVLTELQADIGPAHRLSFLAIREPPIGQLPKAVSEVQASRQLLFAADGMIYHDALCSAAVDLGLEVVTCARGEEMSHADAALGREPGWTEACLRAVARQPTHPWTNEHRRAAAAALSALVRG